MFKFTRSQLSSLKSKYANSNENLERISSFPFISGDTFRSLANLRFENGERSSLGISQRFTDQGIIFIEVDTFLIDEQRRIIVKHVAELIQNSGKQIKVVIHNGDNAISPKYLIDLSERGAQILAVNQLNIHEGVIPIPIGLENAHLQLNGSPSDYINSAAMVTQSERNSLFFTSFNTSTNPKIRGELLSLLKKSKIVEGNFRFTPNEYRHRVLNSKFVFSPPGNGQDCHRTWESIYLGAVPIVLKKYLAESLYKDLPIWAVDSWEEVIDQNQSELESKFVELTSKTTEKAFFTYWANLMLSGGGISQ